MASSQNQRYQERLAARQRGAGTHKIADAGFSIQPLGRPSASAAIPPPPPKAQSPKPATPTSDPLPRRSSRSISRTSSPTVEAIVSTGQKSSGLSPLRGNSISTLEALLQPESSNVTAHRTPPHGPSTPTVDLLSSSISSISRINTPTGDVMASRASTRSTIARTSAIATITPVARGKRTRQPSPDKFLTTPEVAATTKKLEGRVRVGVDQRYQERIAARQRGAGTHKIANLGFSIQPIAPLPMLQTQRQISMGAEAGEVDRGVAEDIDGQQELEKKGGVGGGGESEDESREVGQTGEDTEMAVDETLEMEGEGITKQAAQIIEDRVEDQDEDPVAITSPENRKKRRKVVLEGPEQDSVLSDLVVNQTVESPEETEGLLRGKVVGVLRPRRQRQTVGKKSAPPQIPKDEEDDHGGDEEEAVEKSLGLQEGQDTKAEAEEEEVDGSQIESKRHSRPRQRPKGFTNPQTRAKPKPRRRAQFQDTSGDGDVTNFTFPVTVHRLGKSQAFTLPPGSQRGGVNPIDVINQVSMELVDKYFHKMKNSAERKAVESYKEELSLRFLELTDALEHNIITTARARQAQKRKTQLMTELLNIRQDRAKVAVKIDDVRKAHDLATKRGENQQNISKAFADITGTLERGKARQPENWELGMGGLEALVRKVSATVTGGGRDGTGLLATVVEFNKFLERAESTLREKRH